MWIIYRLWGFLLLKPALGVLQIPAQSIATQSSLLSVESLTAPFPTMTKNRHISDISLSALHFVLTLLTNHNNQKQYQQPKSKGGIRENHSICFKCDHYTPLTSHSLNDRKQM